MRKNHLHAVLSLFLLVPASIICAQTAYLTGTVTAEQDYRTVNFKSKEGNVNVILPGVLSHAGMGTVLVQGTVVAEPSGRNEKEKASNLKALQKMVLTIGQKSIPLMPGQNLFEFPVPPNMATPVPIDMVDPAGNRATVQLTSRMIPDLPSTANLTALFVEQKVFITNGSIPVYASNKSETIFQPTDKFFVKTSTGETREIQKLAQSPTQTVLDGKGIPPGPATITRQSGMRKDEANTRMADLSLTAPNTNLRKGQTSSLTVTIDPKITERDTAEAMQIPVMCLDLKNISPNVIDMAGGNYQVMSFPTGTNPGSSAAWQATRTITGVTTGSFNVSATLHPSPENTNPVHSQLEEIKTAEDFNNWADAIKKDLREYSKDLTSADPVLTDLVRRAIDYMPSVNSEAELDLAKIEMRYLLRDLQTFRNNVAAAGFAAYQAYRANDRLRNSGPKDGWPFHADIIEKGLLFIQNQNTNPFDPAVGQLVNTAMLATYALGQDYSGKNVDELNTALQTLNSTPLVTGFAGPNPQILFSFGLVPDGSGINATKDGEQVKYNGPSMEIFDDNTIVIYNNHVPQVFHGVPAAGTTIKQIVMEFYNRNYPMPEGITNCDSLTKLCKKTQALSLFWGDIYSVTNGLAKRVEIKGGAKETNKQSSLLITRGWEMDCCSGEFKLKLFFQSMNGGEAISMTDQLKSAYWNPCRRPADYCPECEEKCRKDRETRGKNK